MTATMVPLRRHQLAYLGDAAWSQILGRPWDAVAEECLQHWAARRLPLVVARQPAEAQHDGLVALGFPTPAAWERRRIALQVPYDAIAWIDEFPPAANALHLLPRRARAPMAGLLERLASLGVQARAYGSYGWQLLSGFRYVHKRSDLDLWFSVNGAGEADAVAQSLASTAPGWPRVDGELVFLDGAAVAWREWAAWREGRARGVLIKRLHGPSMERDFAPCQATMVWTS
jgi:phosphoribosyl-dephospho-CoA transferase